MDLQHILFYITKSLGIAFVTTLQFIYAIIINMFFDKYLFHDQKQQSSLLYEFLYLCYSK